MKSKVINGIWQLEPETSNEEAAIRSMVERYSKRGVTTLHAERANRSLPAALDQNKVA